MSYCKVHGEYYGYVCEGCQTAEWAQSNPGDYQCPHCKYTSLKYTASRCPLCHGEIESDYWIPIIAVVAAANERSRQQLEKWEEESRAFAEKERKKKQNVNQVSLIGALVILAVCVVFASTMVYTSGQVCVGIVGVIVIIGFLIFMDYLKHS